MVRVHHLHQSVNKLDAAEMEDPMVMLIIHILSGLIIHAGGSYYHVFTCNDIRGRLECRVVAQCSTRTPDLTIWLQGWAPQGPKVRPKSPNYGSPLKSVWAPWGHKARFGRSPIGPWWAHGPLGP